MKYVWLALLVCVVSPGGAAEPPVVRSRNQEAWEVQRVGTRPTPVLLVPTNQPSVGVPVLQGRCELAKPASKPMVRVLDPQPQPIRMKRELPVLSGRVGTPRSIRMGAPQRVSTQRPALGLLQAVEAFNTFFRGTGYQDDHYVNHVLYRYESRYKEWIYDFHVTPAICKEVESTRPGFREFLTTSYQVNMLGEVFVVDTPSWREITNQPD